MGRPRRIYNPRGDSCRLYEIGNEVLSIQLYANDSYKGSRVCLSVDDLDETVISIQTTISDLEQLIEQFKKLRGIKRVRKSAQKGQA